MSQKRRVYIVRKSHEPVEQQILSSMTKVSESMDLDFSYRALITRLHRAKERTGDQQIFVKDKEGNPFTIEVKEIE
ncbi:MAG: hypothetical protein AAGA31_05335 [Bacteroidota bacterium]